MGNLPVMEHTRMWKSKLLIVVGSSRGCWTATEVVLVSARIRTILEAARQPTDALNTPTRVPSKLVGALAKAR